MTTERELTERYLSDARAAKTAFDNGIIDRLELDSTISRVDERFFADLEMLAIVTPTAELVKILAYSVQ